MSAQTVRMTPLPRLLTTGEVAAAFSVSDETVRRWVASGKIEAIETPSGQLRFREDDVRSRLGLDGTAGATAAGAA